jgi:hypothetical protein
MTLFLIHIQRLKVTRLPIPFNPITFNGTYASRDTSINTTINAVVQSAMAEVKHELTTQLESVFASLCTKLKIPTDDSFPDAHTKTEGDTSSHSFQPHNFQRNIRLPRVDVTKFDLLLK